MKRRALILLLILLAARGAFAQGEPQQADEVGRLSRQVNELFSQRRYEEALRLARGAVEAGERLYGRDDLRIAPPLTNLAILSLVRGQYDAAEPAFKRVVELYEQKSGPDDPRLSVVLMPYGWLSYARRDAKRAEALFKRAVAVQEKTYGADNAEVAPYLSALADFYQARDDYEKADALYRRAAALLEKTAGVSPLLTLATLERHLCLQINSSKLKEANRTLERLSKLKPPAEGSDSLPPKKAGGDEQITYGSQTTAGETIQHGFAGSMNELLVSKPLPAYPNDALRARVGGTVVVRVLVDEEGKVLRATPMCSYPSLMEAARKSALSARFRPAESGGKTLKVNGYVFYHFYFDKSTVGQWTPMTR